MDIYFSWIKPYHRGKRIFDIFFATVAIVILTPVWIGVAIAIKIDSNAILNYGTKMTFKDIVKVYRDKNN